MLYADQRVSQDKGRFVSGKYGICVTAIVYPNLYRFVIKLSKFIDRSVYLVETQSQLRTIENEY